MPRKATSKAQYRWFKAVEAGDVKAKGLSPAQAKEMTAGQTPAGLPERSRKYRQAKAHRRRDWRVG